MLNGVEGESGTEVAREIVERHHVRSGAGPDEERRGIWPGRGSEERELGDGGDGPGRAKVPREARDGGMALEVGEGELLPRDPVEGGEELGRAE